MALGTTISAQNTFQPQVYCAQGANIEIIGTGVMTISLQFLGTDGNFYDTGDKFTQQGLYYFIAAPGYYRLGCKTGDYTSGNLTVNIQAGF